MLVFRSGSDRVSANLLNVAHVPKFNHHLFWLRTTTRLDHRYKGTGGGIEVRLNSGREKYTLVSGNLSYLYTFKRGPLGVPANNSVEEACAVRAPGQMPAPTTVDVSSYHCVHGHSHEVALRKIAEQLSPASSGSARDARRQRGSKSPRGRPTAEQL